MAAYAWTPSALTWLHVNHLINGLHKQISWKNCLHADNLYFTLYNSSNNLVHTYIPALQPGQVNLHIWIIWITFLWVTWVNWIEQKDDLVCKSKN